MTNDLLLAILPIHILEKPRFVNEQEYVIHADPWQIGLGCLIGLAAHLSQCARVLSCPIPHPSYPRGQTIEVCEDSDESLKLAVEDIFILFPLKKSRPFSSFFLYIRPFCAN